MMNDNIKEAVIACKCGVPLSLSLMEKLSSVLNVAVKIVVKHFTGDIKMEV